MSHSYFQRHADFIKRIEVSPNPNLGLTVVIPSYNEPNLLQSLNAIANCSKPSCAVEVIVVINYPQGAEINVIENAVESERIVLKTNQLANSETFRFFPIMATNLIPKQAGVGLARKIGMDEAAWRFLKVENPKGIIACFDADSTCEPNYLIELEKLWQRNPCTSGCSINYKHPIEGNEYEPPIYQGIVAYELHLRYYVEAGRFIGHPHSYATIGSSMACSAETYLKVGGMNRRKAGEDFYFLQKIIPNGNFAELNSTCIYPSPRPSLRVPFGTGRAMSKYLENPNIPISTYNIESWLGLKAFLCKVEHLHNPTIDPKQFLLTLHPSLAEFLVINGFEEKLTEIRSNTSNAKAFTKRFYLWFDAFSLLKYLNFAHEKHFDKQPIEKEANELCKLIGIEAKGESITDLLIAFRQKQQSSCWQPAQ